VAPGAFEGCTSFANRVTPKGRGIPRRGLLGNRVSGVIGFSEAHPLLKGGGASFPERDDDTVPSVKAQGSMPRLPFSPTAVPRTDIM
jgi:hypothetical protein